MKGLRLRRFAALLLAWAMALGCVPARAAEVEAAPLTVQSTARNGMVRVYLSSLSNPTQLDITVSGSYTINGDTNLALSSGSAVRVRFDTATGEISLTRNGQTSAMGQAVAFRRHAATETSGLKIAQARKSGNLYPGDLYLTAQKSGSGYRLYAIVHVYIEYYLNGVLPYEMGSGAPAEALKAQAVAARTYTLNKMNLRASGLYDVVDTTNDQVYYGNSDSTSACTAAVAATKGIVLTNDGKLTSCYYTASNGGQTESALNAWGSTGYSYLTVKEDPFDLMNSAATVRAATVYTDYGNAAQKSGLVALLNSKATAALSAQGLSGNIISITNVTPHTPKYAAPSRLYTMVDFDVVCQTASGSRQLTLTCSIFTELENALGLGINGSANELWSVQKQGANWVLQARRYGHGVGMSQRGAMQMASLGYTYDQILGFYYENSVRVRYTFTHTILSALENGGKDTVTSTEEPAEITGGDACTATVQLVSGTDRLAIRASASSNGQILTSLMRGALVTVLNVSGDWTLVQYGEIVGYVTSDALKLQGTPPANASATVTTIAGYATVHASGTLNLRQSASASAKVVSTIPNGTVLPVFSQSNGWARVQYGAQVGYASMDFLVFSGSYPSKVVDSTETAALVNIPGGSGTVNLRATASTGSAVLAQLRHSTSVTALSNDGSWCYVRANNQYGYIMSSFLSFDGSIETPSEEESPLKPGETEAVVQCVAAFLPLLASAEASAHVMAQIPRGESVVVVQRGTPYSQVRYGMLNGFAETVSLTFPSDNQQATILAYARVTTVSGGLNLRTQARAGSPILRVIPRNARVAVLAYEGNWCRVLYDSTMGYVMRSFLTFEQDFSPSPDVKYAIVTTPSGTLNLRAVPSRNAQVLRTIAPSTRLAVLEHGATWCKVQHEGITGYVMTQFLVFEADATATPAPTEIFPTLSPAPTLAPTPTPISGTEEPTASALPTETPAVSATPTPYAELARVHTGNGYLNLREQRSTTSKSLAQIPDGAELVVLSRGTDWSQVVWNNQTGYVMSRFLSFGNEATAAPSPSPLPTEAPTQSSSAAWVLTPSGGLNLRETASANASVLRVIPRLSLVTVYSESYGWALISYQGTQGYVQSRFLTRSDPSQPTGTVMPSPTSSATTAWVLTPSGGLNLRETASTSARVLALIPRLAEVTVLSSWNGWSRITYQKLTGYVQSKFLTSTQPAITPTPAATVMPTTPPSMVNPPTVVPVPTEQPSATPTPQLTEPPRDPTLHYVSGKSARTGDGNVPLYAFCTEDGAPLVEIPSETTLTLMLQGDTWCRVRWEERQIEGYCLTRYLTIMEEGTP